MRSPILGGVLVSVSSLALAGPAFATDIVVHPGERVQRGIDVAVNGDRVLIQPGTYLEAIDFKGKQIEVRGMAGAAATILDASGLGSSVARFLSTETDQTKLAGVTLRGGSGTLWTLAPGQQPTLIGGGIVFAGGAWPIVEDCVIENNIATLGGGCASLMSPFPPDKTPLLSQCTIRSNDANFDGGGTHGSMRLLNCRIEGNRADNGAGAYHPVRAEGCVFADNEALISGGGLVGGQVSAPGDVPYVRSCTFLDNRALIGQGGGLWVQVPPFTPWTLASCRFERNSAKAGDAVSLRTLDASGPANQPRIESCVFAKNGADPLAAAIIYTGQLILIQGCTLDGDRLRFTDTIAPKVSACAFVNDSAALFSSSDPASFDHCVATFSLPGTGNVVASPQFVNAAAGDYHLLPTSPCIEAGNPIYPPPQNPLEPILDIELLPRVQGGKIDAGAHEFPTDCDTDGIVDWIEIEAGAEPDCDGDGWIDSCEPQADCNGNGIQDGCDIASGTASDCNQDGIPDSCQLGLATNFDSDGTLDACQYRLVPQEFPTIQAAIDTLLDPSSVVLVDDGVYSGPGNVEIILKNKPYTIRSRNGPERTFIEPGPNHAFVSFVATLGGTHVIEGFTIRGATSKPAFELHAGNFLLRRCAIVGNDSVPAGLGTVLCATANLTLERCVIANNVTSQVGCAITALGLSDVKVRRCTLAFNTTLPGLSGAGAIQASGGAKVDATECIFAHNAGPTAPCGLASSSGSKITISRSVVEGGAASLVAQSGGVIVYDPSNVAADPQFVPVPSGDVHLTSTSPAIDAGTIAGADFEGDPIVGAPDLGADEFHPHLYAAGDFTAGGTFSVTVIGPPAGGPVLLLAGTSVLSPPQFTLYGPLIVAPPYLGNAPLPIAGSLAPIGFATASTVLPLALPPGYPFRAQALILGPSPVLTNLLALDS